MQASQHRKRAIVDLTVDSPRPPPHAQRGGFTAAAPIDLDSDEEDSGVASSFRPPPATTASASSSSSSTAAGFNLTPTDWLRPTAEVTCPICMCETPPAEAAVLAGCAHAFCEECIGQYVRGKVDEGKVMASQHVESASLPQRDGRWPRRAGETLCFLGRLRCGRTAGPTSPTLQHPGRAASLPVRGSQVRRATPAV